jgi:hypothetical protein
MTKKFLLILALSGLLFGVTAPTANSQLTPEITFGWNTLDYGHPTVNSSYFIGEGSISSNGSLYQPVIATLPQCEVLTGMKLTPSDCIESLEVMNESGRWVRGEIAKHLPVRWQPKYKKIIDNAGNIVEFSEGVIDLPASSAANMFSGGRSALWEFDGVSHENGKQFLFNVDAYGVAINGVVDWQQGFLNSNLYPVTVTEKTNLEKSLNDNSIASYSSLESGTCVQNTSRSYCMKASTFPKDVRFRLTLRLDKAAASLNSDRWFITRTSNPTLEVKESSSYRTMVIEGAPVVVQVPTIDLPRDKDIVFAFVKSWLSTLGKISDDLNVLIQKQADSFMTGNGYIETANNAGSTKIFAGWEPFMKYGSVKQLTGWNFTNVGSSLSSPTLQLKLSGCPKTKNIPGFVSSNSTAIEPGPPTFNTSEQTLEYRVAAPHLTESGSKNSGTYSLYVSSDTARCLWGDNLSSGKATVSILSDDGTTQIATSTFRSDLKGLFFNVSGFHYSTGTIKVRIDNQGAKSVPLAQTPKPSGKTIVCVKGKLTKKVTAVNAKCPAGYKKK